MAKIINLEVHLINGSYKVIIHKLYGETIIAPELSENQVLEVINSHLDLTKNTIENEQSNKD